ncbi:MAG: hypothetical protein AAF539_10105, partial [Planctomycetota bacterium]
MTQRRNTPLTRVGRSKFAKRHSNSSQHSRRASRSKSTLGSEQRQQRKLQHQTLDKRELLAAEIISGPRLISVEAGSGDQIQINRTVTENRLTTSPRELTFRFDGQTSLDPSTLSGIRIEGAGGDGTFGDDDAYFVQPGFLGFADDEAGDRVVVARFNNPLPDDQYRIEIAGYDAIGATAADNVTALRDINGDPLVP